MKLSLLDLAIVGRDEPLGEALRASVTLAQTADQLDCFERLWFAEHHNMPSIASAATSVLLAHIAAHTERIRLGAGGVMLPNHSPLVIAEQFGTLGELHPGRIDLGLGRAPGTDQATVRALRVPPGAAERFPNDVLELQGYLGSASLVPGVNAIPGRGTDVPLYILGSSLSGARLAARLGLPYAFASHFAPDALVDAVAAYRQGFTASAQLTEPYVIAALNVVIAKDSAQASEQADLVLRARVRSLASRIPSYAGRLSDEDVTALLASPVGTQARHMLTYSAVGDPERVRDYLNWFAEHAHADELMVTNPAPRLGDRVRALELLAQVTAEKARR